jgi:hypothetical protein
VTLATPSFLFAAKMFFGFPTSTTRILIPAFGGGTGGGPFAPGLDFFPVAPEIDLRGLAGEEIGVELVDEGFEWIVVLPPTEAEAGVANGRDVSTSPLSAALDGEADTIAPGEGMEDVVSNSPTSRFDGRA